MDKKFLPELENLTFEDAMAQLEYIVKELEGGKLTLQEAVDAFERGETLRYFCENQLKQAQTKIEKVTESNKGELSLESCEL